MQHHFRRAPSFFYAGLVLVLAGMGCLVAAPLLAATGERPSVSARSLSSPPELDGEVLADPIWQPVASTTGFTQTTLCRATFQ